MAKYLVTYDLVGTSENSADYQRLIEQIQTFPNWGYVQRSVWLVQSSKSVTEVYNKLAPQMDGNDRLMVIEVTGVAAWFNEICERPWLEAFLQS